MKLDRMCRASISISLLKLTAQIMQIVFVFLTAALLPTVPLRVGRLKLFQFALAFDSEKKMIFAATVIRPANTNFASQRIHLSLNAAIFGSHNNECEPMNERRNECDLWTGKSNLAATKLGA